MTNFKLLSLAAILSFIGANAMRSFLALGLLIALCASASAATARHSRHVIVHHEHAYAVRGWAYAAPRPVHYDDAPSYNDPSKSGCCN
jgi:hypothetical protein